MNRPASFHDRFALASRRATRRLLISTIWQAAVPSSRTSLGAAGHWIHLAAVAAPLIIGEVIKDPDKRWRALRLAQ